MSLALQIKVFLADDHVLMVEGFRACLKQHGIDVVDVAYSLTDLTQRLSISSADVLVTDLRFATEDGVSTDALAVCEQVLANDPCRRIVVFSQFDDDYLVEKAYRIGVLSFVRKDEDTAVLVDAIKSAFSRTLYFPPAVARQLAWASVKVANPVKLLDEKELEVFVRMADGIPVAGVASGLCLSEKTVRGLIKAVKTKLNIDSYADFTKLAIRFGLTTLEVRMKN